MKYNKLLHIYENNELFKPASPEEESQRADKYEQIQRDKFIAGKQEFEDTYGVFNVGDKIDVTLGMIWPPSMKPKTEVRRYEVMYTDDKMLILQTPNRRVVIRNSGYDDSPSDAPDTVYDMPDLNKDNFEQEIMRATLDFNAINKYAIVLWWIDYGTLFDINRIPYIIDIKKVN